MSSLTLSPKALLPHKAGDFLQIAPSHLGKTISVITDAKQQRLPELLTELPTAIATIAKSPLREASPEQRLHFHDRIVHLKDPIADYNKGIDDDLCITILHIVLLICTFGCFYYRDTWKLQEPQVPLASLFPASFDWEKCKTEFAVDRFRALPEKPRKELSLLLGLDQIQLRELMTGAFAKGETIAEALSPDESDSSSSSSLSISDADGDDEGPPTLEDEDDSIASSSSRKITPLMSGVVKALVWGAPQELAVALTGLPAAKLVEQLGLGNLTEEEAIGGLREGSSSLRSVLSFKLVDLLPLLTKEQWSTLPKEAFFLFLRSAYKETTEWNSQKIALKLISHLDLQECYLNHDPTLEKLLPLTQKAGIYVLDLMLGPQDLQGQVAPSPLTKSMASLSPSTMEALLKTRLGSSLHGILSKEQIVGFSIPMLLQLYSSRTHGQILAPSIKESLAARALAEWNQALDLGTLAITETTLPRPVSQAAAALLPEELWKELPLLSFLSFAQATWNIKSISTNGAVSSELVSVETQISNAAFRTRYLELDPECVYLPSLALGVSGGGAPFLSRLMPLDPPLLKSFLSTFSKQSEPIRRRERESLPGNTYMERPVGVSSLISASLPAEAIAALTKEEFDTLTALWDKNHHPKPSDPNFRPWLERLVKEKKGDELSLIASPSANGWPQVLGSSDSAFLWSLLLAIPYSGPNEKAMLEEYERSDRKALPPHLSDRAFEQARQDRNPSIAFLCSQIPEEPWKQLIATASAQNLTWLLEEGHLAGEDTTRASSVSERFAQLQSLNS